MIKWQVVLLRMHSFPPHIERIHCLPRSSIASSKNSERIQISSMTYVIAAFFMQISKHIEHIVYKLYITIFPFDVSVYFVFHY